MKTDCTDIEELIVATFGEKGSATRDEYERNAEAFRIGALLEEKRRNAGLSQKEFAQQIGEKTIYIARLEKGSLNIPFDVLTHIVAKALGGRLELRFSA